MARRIPHNPRGLAWRIGVSVCVVFAFWSTSSIAHAEYIAPPDHSPSPAPPSVPGGLPDTSDRVVVSEERVGVSGHVGGRSVVVCSWARVGLESAGPPGLEVPVPVDGFERARDGVREVLFARVCGVEWSFVWVAVTSKEELVEAASETVVRFVPHLGVSFAPPKPFVQSATWFFTDRSRWVPVVATAEVDERWVTATATPVGLTLFVEDGDGVGVPVSCGGPGVVPGVGVDLFSVVPSPCSYWWHRSSGFDGDGVSGVRLQVEWDVGWVAWDGSAGSSPPLRVSTTDTVTVQEIQVLITK
jgi:hypothetical protein